MIVLEKYYALFTIFRMLSIWKCIRELFPDFWVTISDLVRSPDMLIFILGELEFSWFNLFKGRSLLILLILIIILFLLKRSTNKFNNFIYQQMFFQWNSCILSKKWIHINTDRTQDVVFSIFRDFSFTITRNSFGLRPQAYCERKLPKSRKDYI